MKSVDLAEALGMYLADHGQRLVCAESCTGGAIAAAVTAIAGSSTWFDRGFVAYSNESKVEMLSVAPELLVAHGSVSLAAVKAMARGALARSTATVALAVSGVAGPGGGSPDKPVGSVCFAWLNRQGYVHCEQHHFEGDRLAIRGATVATALQGLIDFVQDECGPGG